MNFSLFIHVTPLPPVVTILRPKERHLAWILAAHVSRSYPSFFFYDLSISAESFGASGYRISRYTHMKPERVLMNPGPWDIDHLFKVFKSTLGAGLEPARMSFS